MDTTYRGEIKNRNASYCNVPEERKDWYYELNIEGHQYSFSVNRFDEDAHDWLCEVLNNLFSRCHNRAVKLGRREVQTLINHAMTL